MKYLAFFFCVVFCLSSCIQTPNQYTQLPPGEWRAFLKLTDGIPINTAAALRDDDAKILDYSELPFNFSVAYREDGSMYIELINADERIEINDIMYGRDPATAKDTINISFSDFDTELDAFYEENFIEGYWKVPYRGESYRIPFLAQYGLNHRFKTIPGAETEDFSGKWKVEFEYDTENSYPAIAEFKQEGSNITGTFMTETGDYRYLQGNVSGDKLHLSVFDGAHAFLFNAKMINDTLIGEFRSGSHYKCNWLASRDGSFELRSPYQMTKASSENAIEFEFESLNGSMISLNDPKFENKIKLVNIMGTWCPNCKDEIHFLKEFKKENPEVEIISLAFERYKEKSKSLDVLRRYRDKLSINWTVLYGGYANKKENSEQLEFLDTIYSYPTLLILDKSNKIVGIQTGFYGPATSKHSEFKEEFYRILDRIQ